MFKRTASVAPWYALHQSKKLKTCYSETTPWAELIISEEPGDQKKPKEPVPQKEPEIQEEPAEPVTQETQDEPEEPQEEPAEPEDEPEEPQQEPVEPLEPEKHMENLEKHQDDYHELLSECPFGPLIRVHKSKDIISVLTRNNINERHTWLSHNGYATKHQMMNGSVVWDLTPLPCNKLIKMVKNDTKKNYKNQLWIQCHWQKKYYSVEKLEDIMIHGDQECRQLLHKYLCDIGLSANWAIALMTKLLNMSQRPTTRQIFIQAEEIKGIPKERLANFCNKHQF